MKDRFYLACFRDNVGSNVAFHAKDGQGYVTDIGKAHVYTREEAQRAFDHAREFDLPLSADHVDALTVWKVDSQYIPSESQIDAGKRHVAFAGRRWDGNDVYWVARDSGTSTDFAKAAIIDHHETASLIANEATKCVVIPFEVADRVKRRTFAMANVNKRVMVTGAGLVTPDHIKRHKRRRKTTGKTRWNCPHCGRLVWQHNPYDFEGCTNLGCEGHRARLARA